MDKISSFLRKSKDFLIQNHIDGYKWLGDDGLINMESSALLTIFFMIFFPIVWSVILALIVACAKCAFDKSRGHENEKHDLICACAGVIIGAILGSVHAAVILL